MSFLIHQMFLVMITRQCFFFIDTPLLLMFYQFQRDLMTIIILSRLYSLLNTVELFFSSLVHFVLVILNITFFNNTIIFRHYFLLRLDIVTSHIFAFKCLRLHCVHSSEISEHWFLKHSFKSSIT